ncbi:DUF1015 domain-containing protein [Nonomuraea fuscirosea]|uniref:DUF1015 domain-containing protein n=1 Tax=Nonomuraea fuscirosea TaxID=1291556 RepID=UPI002DDA791D|nr:DUF1015 domain-containing protein [Nonomuraea fuscirosea]WSA55327.1 DUF1015 domain-containing protein [Nonomuraea fuscirosea]
MGTPELPVPDGLVLRPFRGVRFAVEDPAKVTSPPYDLISDADVEALLDSHPNNVVRLILPCSTPSDSSSTAHHASEPPAPPAHHPAETSPTTDHSPTADNPPAPSTPPHNTTDTIPPTPPTPTTSPTTDDTPATHQLTEPGAPPHFRPDASSPTGEVPVETRYAEAGRTLKAWLAEGMLVPDKVPALYVYEQSGPSVLQRGLIGDVGLADPAQRIILPHEDVMPGPVADRLALMSTTQANLEPIFLLYEGGSGTATALVDEVAAKRRPLVTAHTEDGLTHRLWAITDPAEIAAINADLHHRQALIADGHHRYATYRVLQRQEHAAAREPGSSTPSTSRPDTSSPGEGHNSAGESSKADTNAGNLSQTPTDPDNTGEARTPAGDPSKAHASTDEPGQAQTNAGSPGAGRAGPWDFGLALLVDSAAYPPDLKAIHRVIPGLPLSEATERARSFWQVRYYDDLASGLAALDSVPEPAFLLAGEGGSRLLTDPDPVRLARAMPPDHSDRWNSLNTSILTEFVLPVVWGMRDDDRTVRIVHHDTDAAARLAVRTGGTAVILRPLAIEDVLAVAAGGERVPRKSTSFGPKPRTGLVLRTFAID